MCGVVGIWSEKEFDISNMMYYALLGLQHRGQEAAGIILPGIPPARRIASGDLSSVVHLFGKLDESFWSKFSIGIGHTRYSTFGSVSKIENVQPLMRENIALAHNGNIRYIDKLKRSLKEDGQVFAGDSDTEAILLDIISQRKPDLKEAILKTLVKFEGSYSMVFMIGNELVAARDPYGFRPLCLAEFNCGHRGYIVASETSAFNEIERILGYEITNVREIEPGEVLIIGDRGLESIQIPFSAPLSRCVFELIYFSRPDSHIFGHDVDKFREKTGLKSAKCFPIEADSIVPIPDSARCFAIGLESGLRGLHSSRIIRDDMAIIRNHYTTGRTFINPDVQYSRVKKVNQKLIILPGRIEGRKIVLVDDSIVRGNTSRNIVERLKGCKAGEITFCVASPPIVGPCYYGIDIKRKEELIAHNRSVDEIRRKIEADKLFYLPIKYLKEVAGEGFCYGCFGEEYPL